MTHRRRIPAVCAMALAAIVSNTVVAADYTPDVYELDGKNSLSFEPAPGFNLAGGGTIEFWISPDWTQDPGYDPTIIANAGPKGPSFVVAMLRDRDGMAIASGTDEDVVTFDFTNHQMHHVAISQLSDGVVVLIDGQVAGLPDIKIRALPSAGFWVGSIDGHGQPFKGAIAALRIWDTPVSQEDLVRFAHQDVFEGDHPDLAHLTALSDFTHGTVLLTVPTASTDATVR